MNDTPNRFWIELGARVARLRTDAVLTQEEVADRLGVTRASVTNLEAGRQRVPVDRVMILAAVFNVSAGQLLAEGDPAPKTPLPGREWTTSQSGRVNNSAEFRRLTAVIEGLIRNRGGQLVNGRAATVATEILSELAHTHGLAPAR